MKNGYDELHHNEANLKPFINMLMQSVSPADVQEILRTLNDAHTTDMMNMCLVLCSVWVVCFCCVVVCCRVLLFGCVGFACVLFVCVVLWFVL